jgi:uncharacterized phage protein (TIGR01671 family)
MGREILFRGKSKQTGKWVWGSLIQNGQYDFAIYDCNEHADYNGEEVQEDTIGEYTNLNDRKGHRIFEGDIVKFHYFFQSLGEGLGVKESEHELTGNIVWGSYGWGIEAIKGEHWQGYTGYDAGEGDTSFMELHELNPSSPHEESFEVIGNIHNVNPASGQSGINHMFDPNNAQAAPANQEAIAEQAAAGEAAVAATEQEAQEQAMESE